MINGRELPSSQAEPRYTKEYKRKNEGSVGFKTHLPGFKRSSDGLRIKDHWSVINFPDGYHQDIPAILHVLLRVIQDIVIKAFQDMLPRTRKFFPTNNWRPPVMTTIPYIDSSIPDRFRPALAGQRIYPTEHSEQIVAVSV